MNRVERAIVVAALLYMAVYIPYFFVQMHRISNGVQISPIAIFPKHLFGMVLNFAALITTIRDLYLRPFANANAKVTWLLLILLTGGIGWLVYIFKHALRPRPSLNAP